MSGLRYGAGVTPLGRGRPDAAVRALPLLWCGVGISRCDSAGCTSIPRELDPKGSTVGSPRPSTPGLEPAGADRLRPGDLRIAHSSGADIARSTKPAKCFRVHTAVGRYQIGVVDGKRMVTGWAGF